ncbi:MAG: undecaprenyl/decaprenyl-phosphate alpha-N-acetylglucosaminyl 1-phosphate transferase [Armatimonadetes bacterium]|nr:undecaprenyl/decaprenyl-phosphate alpha-N-acetylglucosaminyl 1-phosphate transferase [Armatimonadota bacterium]
MEWGGGGGRGPVIAAFAVAALVSLILTPWVGRLAVRCGAVDRPDERRTHRAPTPTWGGLAIFAGFWGGVLIFTWPLSLPVVALLAASIILVAVSVVDDWRGLPPLLRLGLHFGLAAALWLFGAVRIYGFEWPFGPGGAQYVHLGHWSLPLTVAWIVVIVNAINWLDGLDGLAGGVAAIAAATLAVLAARMGWRETAVMGASLGGAALGFLRYNVKPARIFMGDTGAMFLGLVLACMAAIGPLKVATSVTVLIPLLVLGVPIYDLFTTLTRRMLGRKAPHVADRQHVHHRLLGRGWSEDMVVLVLWVITGGLGLVAVLVLRWLGRI